MGCFSWAVQSRDTASIGNFLSKKCRLTALLWLQRHTRYKKIADMVIFQNNLAFPSQISKVPMFEDNILSWISVSQLRSSAQVTRVNYTYKTRNKLFLSLLAGVKKAWHLRVPHTEQFAKQTEGGAILYLGAMVRKTRSCQWPKGDNQIKI